MMESFQALVAWLGDNPSWLSCAIFGIAFVESLAIAGIIVPGVAMLFAAATLAGRVHMPLPEALIWAALGAIAGDAVSYALGRQLEGRLNRVWPLSRYPGLIANGEQFFQRHGGKSVVIGRFVGPIRPILPLIAGALEMPAGRFFMFNIFSAIGWAPAYVIPGFLVGSALTMNISLPAHFYPILTVFLAALCLLYLLTFRLHRALGPGQTFYERLAARLDSGSPRRRFCQRLSSPREDDQEFPLASLVLATAACAFFIIWTLLDLQTGLLTGPNQAVNHFMSELRHPVLDSVFVIITMLAGPEMMIVYFGVAITVLALRRFYAAAIHVMLAGLAVSVLTTLIKSGLAVARPGEFSETYGSFAFPSGHASGITVLMGLAASFVAQERHRSKRWLIYVPFSIPILLVVISRLYLGVHWLTDVVGGILLGLTVCGITRVSFSPFNRRAILLDRWTIAIGLIGLAVIVAVAGSYVERLLPSTLDFYSS